MNYENKYKELEGKIKKAYLYAQTDSTKAVLEDILPELKDNDERIRKTLIDFFSKGAENREQTNGIYDKDIIAWLEKQDNKPVNIDIESMVSSYKQRLESQGNGGMRNNPLVNMCLTAFKHGVEEVLQELNLKEFEKPQGESEIERIRKAVKAIKEEKIDNANKVEPKFKVGEWIVDNEDGDFFEVTKVRSHTYHLLSQEGEEFDIPLFEEENYHKFSIQDSKDGDVLAAGEKWTCIFKSTKGNNFSSYCWIDTTGYFFSCGSEAHTLDDRINGKLHPATKEQCDKLLKAMTDAGWQFDFEKKELKKVEQSPVWSEEDKNFMHDTISNLIELKDRYGEGYGNVGKCIDWLKSLRPRKQWKPSEEQIQCLHDAIEHYHTNGYPASKLNELYEQMSKIYKL